MATFDMSYLENEPLEFKNLYGNDYTIPGDISVEFMLKLSKLDKKREQAKDQEKQIEVMVDFVAEILNLDESQEISVEEIRQKFNFKAMQIIISEWTKHIQKLQSDPNSESPSSK
ncbi:hypothetical protein [Sporolactobacillus terrae]|uniref:hypothetical protein n=1 Tax=Sporolactobacillus terrae TaxID=269673 RepID=UPI00159B9EA7|nr:hypothetical protein [Sporolactobacillus terrae]